MGKTRGLGGVPDPDWGRRRVRYGVSPRKKLPGSWIRTGASPRVCSVRRVLGSQVQTCTWGSAASQWMTVSCSARVRANGRPPSHQLQLHPPSDTFSRFQDEVRSTLLRGRQAVRRSGRVWDADDLRCR